MFYEMVIYLINSLSKREEFKTINININKKNYAGKRGFEMIKTPHNANVCQTSASSQTPDADDRGD